MDTELNDLKKEVEMMKEFLVSISKINGCVPNPSTCLVCTSTACYTVFERGLVALHGSL